MGDGAFLELPTPRTALLGQAKAEERYGAAGACRLVLTGDSRARLTIELREPDPETVQVVCQLVVTGVVSRRERSRR